MESGKYYFLSRPRRFGKSLLVDTLQQLFEGNEPLFRGLFIHSRHDWSRHFPVIKIDFAGGELHSLEELNQLIRHQLEKNQRRLQLDCGEWQGPSITLQRMIELARERFGERVVVLVDEYDKPILDNLEQPGIAEQMRSGLKNLYSAFKEEDANLQFVLLTGVSKFSKASIFSGINQLQDISLNRHYATICGYTEHDLDQSFADHLAGVDRSQLREWYNGHSFLGDPVYNPFDVLLFISEGKRFQPYWFETGSPTFLIRLFRQRNYFLPRLHGLLVGRDILDSYDIEEINPLTLLFQAGYLTIEEEVEVAGQIGYRLKMPNKEVTPGVQHPSDQRLQRPARTATRVSAGGSPVARRRRPGATGGSDTPTLRLDPVAKLHQ